MISPLIEQRQRQSRRKFTPEQRDIILRGFYESGKSIVAYAKQIGMVAGTLGNWTRRFPRVTSLDQLQETEAPIKTEKATGTGSKLTSGTASQMCRMSKLGFVEAVSMKASSEEEVLEICLSRLIRLEIRSPGQARLAGELLRAYVDGEAPC